MCLLVGHKIECVLQIAIQVVSYILFDGAHFLGDK